MVATDRTIAVVPSAKRNQEKDIRHVKAPDGAAHMMAPNDGTRCESSALSSLKRCFISFSIFSVFIEMF